jgi:hypothetical protein
MPAEVYAMPSDLVQVETTHVTAAEADEQQQPLRRPRRPRAPDAAPEAEPEPLVQIETRPLSSQTD